MQEFEADQRKGRHRRAGRITARKQIEHDSRSLEETLTQRLGQERVAIESKAREKAKADLTAQMAHWPRVGRTRAKLAEAQKAELDLIKQRRSRNQKNELNCGSPGKWKRRGKIRDDAKKEASDERALKDAENSKLISDLTKLTT
jgi:hypothetical protein